MDIHLYSEGETWFVWRDGTRRCCGADASPPREAGPGALAEPHRAGEPPPAPVTATPPGPASTTTSTSTPTTSTSATSTPRPLRRRGAGTPPTSTARRAVGCLGTPRHRGIAVGAASSVTCARRRAGDQPRRRRTWSGPPVGGAGRTAGARRSLLLPAGGAVPEPWADCERAGHGGGARRPGGPRRRAPRTWRHAGRVRARSTRSGADAVRHRRRAVGGAGRRRAHRRRHRELLRANAVDDATAGTDVVATGAAVAAGAEACTGDAAPGTADVVLGDGRAAWCDGGPLQAFAPDEAVPGTVVVPRVTLERGRLDPNVATVPAHLHDALAPDQLAAVTDPRPRARIIAPAGSGKTRC
ncbi:MAG: hypothetical protein R2699_00795 [Acidimicrobiales bacterium]